MLDWAFEGPMELGLGPVLGPEFPGPVTLTLDSILEGILQDENSSSSDQSSKVHLSLDNIPDALPIKDEVSDSTSVDIMVSKIG